MYIKIKFKLIKLYLQSNGSIVESIANKTGKYLEAIPESLRILNSNFNILHYEVDYYLRARRWDTTAQIKLSNTEKIRSIGRFVDDIEAQRELTLENIANRRNRLGVNNPCLAAVDRVLHSETRNAGYALNHCAENIYANLTESSQETVYSFLNAIQRQSTEIQHITLSFVGMANPVSDLDLIIGNLEAIYDDGSENFEESTKPIMNYELAQLNRELVTIRNEMNDCMATVVRAFVAVSNRLRGHSTLCI